MTKATITASYLLFLQGSLALLKLRMSLLPRFLQLCYHSLPTSDNVHKLPGTQHAAAPSVSCCFSLCSLLTRLIFGSLQLQCMLLPHGLQGCCVLLLESLEVLLAWVADGLGLQCSVCLLLSNKGCLQLSNALLQKSMDAKALGGGRGGVLGCGGPFEGFLSCGGAFRGFLGSGGPFEGFLGCGGAFQGFLGYCRGVVFDSRFLVPGGGGAAYHSTQRLHGQAKAWQRKGRGLGGGGRGWIAGLFTDTTQAELLEEGAGSAACLLGQRAAPHGEEVVSGLSRCWERPTECGWRVRGVGRCDVWIGNVESHLGGKWPACPDDDADIVMAMHNLDPVHLIGVLSSCSGFIHGSLDAGNAIFRAAQ